MYHWTLAWAAALRYGFPSRNLFVIGVTGTNGKSTVVALLSAILQEAGVQTASASSLRFQIRHREEKNMLKMTMPGRFKLQRFLRSAVRAGCTHAVIEVTSEGIKQYRHLGISFSMAILTNVTPEHIESHGGFENYRATKAKLFYNAPIHVLNADDKNIHFFQLIPAKLTRIYSRSEVSDNVAPQFIGDFNKENIAAAIAAARILNISDERILSALKKIKGVPGRLEFVVREPFSVIVDYAHTPDALTKVYETLNNYKLETKNSKLICVLGSAGGGRDVWKRPEMGAIAAGHCDQIFITNEDPYDEDPMTIIKSVARGAEAVFEGNDKQSTINSKLQIVPDRREAIQKAVGSAQRGDVVIITGKGAEPFLVAANGEKIPWDDREVVKEELARVNRGTTS
jgi:UDP-N-acetylmuramoyl-L-alanyl-D-glutamate--2,6-diaminopimelate ligase